MTRWEEFTGPTLKDEPSVGSMRRYREIAEALREGGGALEELAEIYRAEQEYINPDDYKQEGIFGKSAEELDQEFINQWWDEEC